MLLGGNMVKVERTEHRTKNIKVKEFKDKNAAILYISNKTGEPVDFITKVFTEHKKFNTPACSFRFI